MQEAQSSFETSSLHRLKLAAQRASIHTSELAAPNRLCVAICSVYDERSL